MKARTLRSLSAPVVALALSFGLAACGSDDASDAETPGTSDTSSEVAAGEVTITDAWVRQPAEGQTVAAGYGTIVNDTDEPITLIGASAPITATFEIHETMVDDEGVMSMQEKEEGFTIEPGGSFTLEPGGPHVMMLEVDPTEFTGPIELTFVFDSTEVTVTAELREIGDAMEGMDDMDDGSMDDGSMDDGSMDEMDDGSMETEDTVAGEG